MNKEMLFSGKENSAEDDRLKVAIVCLYGYPHRHDTEPFAGLVLKGQLDERFQDQISSYIYILGHNQTNEKEVEELALQLVKNNSSIIGVSVPQGTLRTADEFLSALEKVGFKGKTVLGHALPTYQPEHFLKLNQNALIVKGWGEKAFGDIVENELTQSQRLNDIPNLVYLKDGAINQNRLEWPNTFIPSGGHNPSEFFPRIEASRGCHHNVCTYCTRPPREKAQAPWVRIPPGIVLKDIENLQNSGVSKFTFTDEDFFGNDLDGAMQIAEGLKNAGCFTFTLDLRADSILNPSDSPERARYRDQLLKVLIDAGLSLVYVGVESLSKGQLLRYGKGVTPAHEVAAIRKLNKLSVPLELGLITFDPLLSISELTENVKMLDQTGLWLYSGLMFSELRVSEDNPYCRLLKKHGLGREFDPDYITYSYEYLHPDIKRIRDICIAFRDEVGPVYYSARNIFRTSFELPNYVKTFIEGFRKNELEVLKQLIQNPSQQNDTYRSARNTEHLRVERLKSYLEINSSKENPEYTELKANIDTYLHNWKE